MPSEWKARYDVAVREEIVFVSPASRERKRTIAIQTANQVANEYKPEQARTQAVQERQGRESMKSSVCAVDPYLKKLHSNNEFYNDDDLARKNELEQAVRKALEDRLTGGEGLEDVQQLVGEVLDAELES